MRLTTKIHENYCSNENGSFHDLYNKLGQLEDIEDELGIDLATIWKACTNGVWHWAAFQDCIENIGKYKPSWITCRTNTMIYLWMPVHWETPKVDFKNKRLTACMSATCELDDDPVHPAVQRIRQEVGFNKGGTGMILANDLRYSYNDDAMQQRPDGIKTHLFIRELGRAS